MVKSKSNVFEDLKVHGKTDSDGAIILISSESKELLGYHPEELTSQSLFMICKGNETVETFVKSKEMSEDFVVFIGNKTSKKRKVNLHVNRVLDQKRSLLGFEFQMSLCSDFNKEE